MEDKNKILSRLQGEVIPGINLFELVLFSTTMVLATILFFLSMFMLNENPENNDLIVNILILIDIPIGIIAATFLAKKNKTAPLLLAIDALVYGAANFLGGQYALGFVSFILLPIIYMIGFLWIWPREKSMDGKEVLTKKLNLKTGFIMTGLAISFSVLFGITLTYIEGGINDGSLPNWVFWFEIWFDTFSASLMLVSVIVAVFKYREAWYFFIISNALKVMLFTILVAYGDLASIELLVLSISYFINSVFGLLVWNSTHKEIK